MRRLRGHPARSDEQRHFVHRRDAEDYAAVSIRVREHRCISDEWLRAQNALRLGAPHLGAGGSQLEREIAADHRFLGGDMLLGGEAPGLLPDGIAVDPEGRVRIDVDATDALPLAGHRRAAQTLSLCPCRRRGGEQQCQRTLSKRDHSCRPRASRFQPAQLLLPLAFAPMAIPVVSGLPPLT